MCWTIALLMAVVALLGWVLWFAAIAALREK